MTATAKLDDLLNKVRAEVLAEKQQQPVAVALAPEITIKLAAKVYGLSEKAIRRKKESGVWLEGREWRRAPDGSIWIITAGVSAWIAGSRRPARGARSVT